VVDQDTVRQRLIEHAGDLDPEQLRRPRIVLVAGSFPPVVTATVVWLSEMGVDVALQRVQAYRVFDDKTVVTVSQLFPVADVEEFTVSPQRQQLQAAEERRRTTREKSTVQRLVTAGSIPDGTPLMLRPTTEVTPEVRTAIEAWVNQDPRRGRAHWYNDRRQPLAWEYDGGRYRPTEIVRRILADAAGVQRNPRGPAWWVMEDGRDLPTVAGVPERSTFDWAELHQVLEAIPVGRWTTYGELAALIGTAAQPLGQHIQHCPACPNVHRVLGADGKPRPGLAWVDPNETRGQQEWLQAEGVRFSNGAAEPGRHLDVEALAALVEQE
jgi:alkylated DNA nucleotide flippase Atl1/uncharacterized protein YciI